jgi:hypothetical protein
MRPIKLSDFSDEDLKDELERRKVPALPARLNNPDFTALINAVVDHVNRSIKSENSDDDKQWIFEAAVEAVYGKDCWVWWNKLPGNR